MGLFNFKKTAKKPKKQEEKLVSDKEKIEPGQDGLTFNAKFQIITKDKKYAREISDKYIKNIENSKDAKGSRKYFVLKKEIDAPRKLKKNEMEGLPKGAGKNIFISMLSIDISTKRKTNVFDFCFEYMPFFIEITSPMSINFTADELTNYITSIQATIHKIDEDLKITKLRMEEIANKHSIMSKNMVRLLRNNIILSLKEKDKDLKTVAENVGIPEEQLGSFVDKMVADNEIKLEKDKYKIVK